MLDEADLLRINVFYSLPLEKEGGNAVLNKSIENPINYLSVQSNKSLLPSSSSLSLPIVLSVLLKLKCFIVFSWFCQRTKLIYIQISF